MRGRDDQLVARDDRPGVGEALLAVDDAGVVEAELGVEDDRAHWPAWTR